MAKRLINRLPKDHRFRDIDGLVTAQRARHEVDGIYDFENNELERNDVEVERSGDTATIDPTRHLTDDEFDTFREKSRESDKVKFSPSRKTNVVQPANLDTPDPLRVHTQRDRETMETDKSRKARVTIDPVEYAKAPNHFDFPFLDTTPEFEEEALPIDTEGWLERQAGPDDMFRL